MRQLSTGHPDVILIEPQFFRDDRGYFCETYNQQSFAKIGISDKFVQDNESAQNCIRTNSDQTIWQETKIRYAGVAVLAGFVIFTVYRNVKGGKRKDAENRAGG